MHSLSPSSLQALNTHTIDLWSIAPSKLSPVLINYLTKLLSVEETTKIQRFKHKTAQQTALVTRAMCRLVVSQYAKESPSSLMFTRNKHGKPELTINPKNIRFNLSHNDNLIVIAICVSDDIGCDIETPERKISIEPISRRYFATQEHKELMTLNSEQQKQRFFEFWTLKEAFVKATGVGIGLGLDTFYFEFDESPSKMINIQFNEHYPLKQDIKWQCYQTMFEQQSLAICRQSNTDQTVKYFNAMQLIPDLEGAIESMD